MVHSQSQLFSMAVQVAPRSAPLPRHTTPFESSHSPRIPLSSDKIRSFGPVNGGSAQKPRPAPPAGGGKWKSASLCNRSMWRSWTSKIVSCSLLFHYPRSKFSRTRKSAGNTPSTGPLSYIYWLFNAEDHETKLQVSTINRSLASHPNKHLDIIIHTQERSCIYLYSISFLLSSIS